MEKQDLIHRGNIVRAKIKDCGYDYNDVYEHELLNWSQPTFNKHMNNPKLGYKQIRLIGEIIHHDFSKEFPEMKPITQSAESGVPGSLVNEPQDGYKIIDCWKSLRETTAKYIKVLEEKNALQSAYIDLLNKQ